MGLQAVEALIAPLKEGRVRHGLLIGDEGERTTEVESLKGKLGSDPGRKTKGKEIVKALTGGDMSRSDLEHATESIKGG